MYRKCKHAHTQLPLTLLNAAVGQPVLVELKSGETYNGTLESCDVYMNMLLKGAVCTSRTAEHFTRCTECYIRGNTIKYVCVPDEVAEKMPPPEEDKARAERFVQGAASAGSGSGRSGARGRGRGGMHSSRGGGRGGGRGGRVHV